MGGPGSGRFGYRGGRQATDVALRITIGGLLHGSLPNSGIGTLHLPDDRILINFFGRKVVEATLTTTRQGHGGLRRWFACPDCGRRCAVVYLRGGILACRQCHGLIYASQLESHGSRKLHKLLRREWALLQLSRISSSAQAGAVSGKVISEKN